MLADTREQQKAVTELQSQLQAQLKLVNGELAALRSGQVDGGKLDTQFKGLNEQVAALKAAQVDGAKLDGQLKSLGSEVAALKKQGNPSAAIQDWSRTSWCSRARSTTARLRRRRVVLRCRSSMRSGRRRPAT